MQNESQNVVVCCADEKQRLNIAKKMSMHDIGSVLRISGVDQIFFECTNNPIDIIILCVADQDDRTLIKEMCDKIKKELPRIAIIYLASQDSRYERLYAESLSCKAYYVKDIDETIMKALINQFRRQNF